MKNTKRVVVATAIKTLVLLVLITILVSVVFCLAKPSQAGDFFYTVGMKGISARATLRAAQDSGEIEDYYTALVRAYDAKNTKIAAYAASAMLTQDKVDSLYTSAQYSNFTKKMDDQLATHKGATDQYIKMVFAYSQMRQNKGVDSNGSLWNKITEYCKGTGVYYYYNSVCPVTGYINAIIDSNSSDMDTICRVLLQMKEMDEGESVTGFPYWRSTTDNTMESIAGNYFDAQTYMLADISRLIEDKGLTVEKIQQYAQDKTNGVQFIEAYNYWAFLMA